MTTFKALWVQQNAVSKFFTQEVVERQIDQLPAGEVLVKVHYSSLNYKDALSAKGNKGVTKHYPHTPGIDAAGEVVESATQDWQPGDKVIVTGYNLGMDTPGGFGQYIRVPANWVFSLPEGISLYDAMALGTAGLTAALSLTKLQQMGVMPDSGEVFVTGASGGVGSLSIALLAKLGYTVAACTGKLEQAEYLSQLGATKIIDRETAFEGVDRPLLSEQWAGAIDTVGGDILFNVIKSLKYGGSVASCGLVASPNFQVNVFPFILRGVNWLGIDSVELPLNTKQQMFTKLADEWRIPLLDKIVHEITLEELPHFIESMFKGRLVGRVVVNLMN
ncbi:YhdH/YhfP family quinone oxidoreductase [Endozoicomonas sp. SM1973]|uniref:YhdH/YhfP family quinone oxidoreductase n=1 Tax=Spartinivicinus marinus TaxID=2994442 RepID=A0A853IFI5_9GAMM|nr:YhdH/YhfP family quinone oxidoreductase [Spartinivicinus marinus]MCX4024790.1 YhdH/YhfP family quinone oxidoreductase [Spartinivicinus marinus]NYZ68741.1 YhdH/YhfP family quinone oxidoreductase [Spartinivicinus marinus]